MPLLLDVPIAEPSDQAFTVFHQKLEFEVDFTSQSIKGRTELLIVPQNKHLRRIPLHCRQATISRVTVEGKPTSFTYDDRYKRVKPRPSASVHQHHLLRQRLDSLLGSPANEELIINIPKSVSILEYDPFSAATLIPAITSTSNSNPTVASSETPAVATAADTTANFQPIKVSIDFDVRDWRDGLHFVGLNNEDQRYPCLYTRRNIYPGSASCLFPCVDRLSSMNTWEISVTCARTLAASFPASQIVKGASVSEEHVSADKDNILGFSEDERAMEMVVVCSGDLVDEIVDPLRPSKKTYSFLCAKEVAAQHIGFAVGPFQHVDLSIFREIDEDDKLGDNATRIHGFCLPGREDEVRNICLPLAKAVDFFTMTYGAYPFPSYKICFVNDLPTDTISTAGLSLCSTRLLFPETILEPLDTVTRVLLEALASQWLGVSIVPDDASDVWAVVGLARYVADTFLRKLMGNNEYRYQQKRSSDTVFEIDRNRPSLHALGAILHLDPSELEFLTMKAGVVLFILDRRLTKANGSSSISRVVSRICSNAKAGEAADKRLSTSSLQKLCEKIGHTKLDTFFQQWVFGAGCPHFQVRQQFNKKKLVVEMTIQQAQQKYDPADHDIDPNCFLRDVREEKHEIFAGSFQPVFTGPMTIRIHEADGTPYEHIVEIKEAKTRIDIPYNTKYKRLKRSRRQKERAAANSGVETAADAQDDVLLYCLGDVLQTQEEVADWRLADWPKEEEDKMSQESYEWIRMDADFEWICKMTIHMPAYMFVSQLQQDRDVVAQIESVQYLLTQRPNPLNSTILLRTLMDRRYFHGVRTLATTGLTRAAQPEFDWIGLFHLEKAFQEFYCFADSSMTRPNDFSDRTSYFVQCAIPKAISKIKDYRGQSPSAVKQFFLDKLKFNDNSNNEFSDIHYIATLLNGLAETFARPGLQASFKGGYEDEESEDHTFKKAAINEIERYRRIDEWTSSYQNMYSITALNCLAKLAKSGIIRLRITDFLQYTRQGMADDLRLTAMNCLVELGVVSNHAILRHLFYAFSTDTSPRIRQVLFQMLGRSLGQLAVGRNTESDIAQPSDGLIIEQDGSTDERQADFVRKRTLPGALAALKISIGQSEALKVAIWDAICSPVLAMPEVADLVDLCEVLYEEKTSLIVKLAYPRYWKVIHAGRGVMKFWKTDRIRVTPIKVPQPIDTIGTGNVIQVKTSHQNKAEAAKMNDLQSGSIEIKVANGSAPPPPVRTPTILKLKTKPLPPPRLSMPISPASATSNPDPWNVADSSASEGNPVALAFGVQPGAMSPPPRPSSSSSKRRKSSASQDSPAPLAKRPTLKLRLSSGAGSPTS